MLNNEYDQPERGFLYGLIRESPVIMGVVALCLYVLADIGITSIKTNQYDQFVSQQAEVYASNLSQRAKNDSLGALARRLDSWFPPAIGFFSGSQAANNHRLAKEQFETVASVRADQARIDSVDAACADSAR